ncbi:MAG: thioredoxin domain-containing protein [Candidatus Krumholzibacteriota bacterium]|nr:thioredoxin domain-containing protein [Candidatus Krumholzibacteriota bacterium]
MNPAIKTHNQSRVLAWGITLLVAIGLGLSGYLLLRTFHLGAGRGQLIFDACSAIFGGGCDATLLGSGFLGIPVAGWGVVYFGTLASLLFLMSTMGAEFGSEAGTASVVLSVAGSLVSLTLLGVFAAGRVPFCPMCVFVHALNLVLAAAIWRRYAQGCRPLIRSVTRALKLVFVAEADLGSVTKWKSLAFVTVLLVSVVIYQWIYVETELRAPAGAGEPTPEAILTTFASTAVQDVRVGPDDPLIGSANAPVTLVVFSDFQCPFCESFSDQMYFLLQRFDDDLAVVFKHFPLGSACNPSAKNNTHPNACPAAHAAEAARKQGGFWTFHDGLFDQRLEAGEDAIQQVAELAGLRMEQFETDRRSEQTMRKVESDIEQGIELGVAGTPTVFVNGREVPRLTQRTLEVIIEKEIEAVRP